MLNRKLIVDVNNLHLATRRAKRPGVDFRILQQEVAEVFPGNYAPPLAYYNMVGDRADSFRCMLRNIGFHSETKPPRKLGGALVTNWNVEIALRTVQYLAEGLHVVLATNDLDLYPLLQQHTTGISIAACGIPTSFKQLVPFHELSQKVTSHGTFTPT